MARCQKKIVNNLFEDIIRNSKKRGYQTLGEKRGVPGINEYYYH